MSSLFCALECPLLEYAWEGRVSYVAPVCSACQDIYRTRVNSVTQIKFARLPFVPVNEKKPVSSFLPVRDHVFSSLITSKVMAFLKEERVLRVVTIPRPQGAGEGKYHPAKTPAIDARFSSFPASPK